METKTLQDLLADDWYCWAKSNSTFRYQPTGSYHAFAARKEIPKNAKIGYWYAYRKIDNKQYKRYIGKTEDLTFQRLEAIAEQLHFAPQTATQKLTDAQPKVTLKTLGDDIKHLKTEIAQISQLKATIKQLIDEVALLKSKATQNNKE